MNKLKGAGISLSLADYVSLPSLVRDDLLLWNEAEARRAEDDAELARLGAARGDV